jgi:hypothetical protein
MRPDETFGSSLASLAPDGLASADDVVGPAIVMDLGHQQADATVKVLGVVPGDEALAQAAGLLDRAEAFGELGSVLQGLELTSRGRAVIGGMRPAMGFGDAPAAREGE